VKQILDYWNRRWQSVAFDLSSGQGHIRWFARKPKQCAGWAFHHDGRWYAARREEGCLVFQTGCDKWNMDGDLRCKNTRHGTTRLFTIQRGNDVLLNVGYESATELDEPTADRLDLETTDFFYWVASVWNDPALKESLRTAWKGTPAAA
jgi:hypothetical protein